MSTIDKCASSALPRLKAKICPQATNIFRRICDMSITRHYILLEHAPTIHMGVCINGGTPKWWVYKGKFMKIPSIEMDDLGLPHAIPIFGSRHIPKQPQLRLLAGHP